METITVKPAGDKSWMVEYSGSENPLLFMTGALAERAAKRLAEQLARAGRPARISAGSFVGAG